MEMNMKDMAAAMAGQTEDVRRTMLSDRLNTFYEMPGDKRENAMKMMVEGVYSLSEEDMQKLIATRTAILADFPEEKRKTLMSAHMQVLQSFPEEKRDKEMQLVMEAAGGLPEPQKTTMMSALHHSMGHSMGGDM